MNIILKENDARQIIAEPLNIGDFSEGLKDDISGAVNQPYEHRQYQASDRWVIPHNLGRKITGVRATSSTGFPIEGVPSDGDDELNVLILDFITPIAGSALVT